MPKGLRRRYGQRHLHFITCSCYRRLPLFASVRSKNLFAKILGEVRDRYGFALVGYVVMPEHIHLLISEPAKGTPSTIMQVLKQRVSRLPAIHGCTGISGATTDHEVVGVIHDLGVELFLMAVALPCQREPPKVAVRSIGEITPRCGVRRLLLRAAAV